MSQLQNIGIFHKCQVTEHKFQVSRKPYGTKVAPDHGDIPRIKFYGKMYRIGSATCVAVAKTVVLYKCVVPDHPFHPKS